MFIKLTKAYCLCHLAILISKIKTTFTLKIALKMVRKAEKLLKEFREEFENRKTK